MPAGLADGLALAFRKALSADHRETRPNDLGSPLPGLACRGLGLCARAQYDNRGHRAFTCAEPGDLRRRSRSGSWPRVRVAPRYPVESPEASGVLPRPGVSLATARTARTCRRTCWGESVPAGNSTVIAAVPGTWWFCQFAAVPDSQ